MTKCIRFLFVPALVSIVLACTANPGAGSPAVPPEDHASATIHAPDSMATAMTALIETSGSNCQSSFEGDLVLDAIDFEGMARSVGPDEGVLEDRRGWVGSLSSAREHFGASTFVVETKTEHWFITRDAAALRLFDAAEGPVAAALIEVPLSDGRTVWYLGPRWVASIPCPE